MLSRLVILIIIVGQVLFFVPGCEQIKDYRKRAYYEKGLELYEAQQFNQALKQIDFALAFDEEYLDALILGGMCQFELKNFRGAADAFDYAFSLDKSRVDLALKAAEAFVKVEDLRGVKKEITAILAIDPLNAHAFYFDAISRLRSRKIKQWASVESILKPLLDNEEYRDRAYALLAEFNILNDNLEQSEKMLMQHANANDDWFFVMSMLAGKYASRNDPQAAIRIYRKILELKPDSNQDIQQLLFILRSSGRKEEERQLLDSLIAVNPQQVRYKLALIEFCIHYGQFAEAEEHIRAGIESGSDFFDFSRVLIEVYEKTNRYAVAIQVAKDVLGQNDEEEAFEREIEFMNILARLYYESNNREMAKVVVRWILDLNKDNHSARFLLARISLDEGWTLLAISELRGLCVEDINNPDYDYYIGLAHMARAEKSNAEQSFKECLNKQPSYKPALLEISKLYFEKGYLVDLKSMTDEFLTISPNDPDVLALQVAIMSKIAVTPEGG